MAEKSKSSFTSGGATPLGTFLGWKLIKEKRKTAQGGEA
jgi:hypothetical protein